jgi:hypothetical protein
MKLFKKTGVMAAGIAVISMVTVSGCGKTATPQERVQGAMEKFSAEMEDYTASISDEIGWEQLEEYIETNPVHSNIDLSMTIPDNEDLGNISLTLDTISDRANKAFDADINVGAYGISLPLGNLIYSDEKLYIKSDKIFDSDVYSIDCNSFVKDFNNSAWSQMLGTQIPEDVVDSYKDASSFDISGLKESFTELVDELKANASYSLLKDKKDFELDGKTSSCVGVEVAVDKDAASQAFAAYIDGYADSVNSTFEDYLEKGIVDSYDADDFNEMAEELKNIELKDDLKFDIYLDSNGRMVNISTPNDIEFTGESGDIKLESVSFDINFNGTERRADNIDGKIYVKVDGAVNCYTISRLAEVNDTQYNEDIELTYESDSLDDFASVRYTNNWNKEDLSYDITLSLTDDGEEEFGFYADGYFTDIVKGEAFTFKLNNAKLVSDGENELIVSCKFTVEPTDETVIAPSSSIDLMGMSESEIENMLYGAIIKISQIGTY